jgi:Mn-dependent DtxR family transcriptional regulator
MVGYNPYFFNQVQQNQTQVQFSYVSSMQDAQSIPVQFNTIYVALNKIEGEIYIKQLNRDGLIDFDTYKKVDNNKKEDEMSLLLARISKLEENFKTEEKKELF